MSRTASLEEMAAVGLWDLPDVGLLGQVKTQDQQDYWEQLKAFYFIVSLCWRSKLLNPSAGFESFDDPLYSILEAKEVDKIHYELVWRRANRLQALYKVLEMGEEYIAEEALDLGFNYPYTLSSLFGSIIKNDVDSLFKVCLEPYKNVLAPNILTASKLLLKLSKYQVLKPEEIRKIKHLDGQLQNNKLHGFAIQACAHKAQQDEKLRQLLMTYVDAIRQEAEVTKTATSRTRDSKTFNKPRSFVWQKGNILYADCHGGTYNLNKT